MAVSPSQQIERLKQALAEMRANKDSFSDAAFAQVVMVLLEKLRRLQTILPTENAASDEIRLVTVMFIDVKDSTEMARTMDTSDWKGIISATHEHIADVVAQWDGQIGQYLGDGVLCFFGAQRSRGDDAPHAVSCALQIQSVLGGYAETIRAEHEIDFGVRIGISTGRVVVGMIGSQTSKQELLALGPATNLAARLQGLAPVGGVLVDGTTYNRIRRDYLTQALPPTELKGFDEPVNIYRVLQRRTSSASQFTETKIAGIELPLVGRDEDLALINYLCDRALQDNNFQVITLTGDVGMGKSRLLQEAVHLTDSHFLHIIMSSQYETRSKSQNLLWDMLMAQCHLTEEMETELIRQQITAYISELWQNPESEKAAAAIGYLAGFDFEAPDGNLFDWVLRWFEGVAEKHHILIAVDNLQWMDEQSAGLLEQIAIRLSDKAGVLIAAGQPEYSSIYPSYMKGHPRHTRISLERLKSEFTRTLIDTVFKQVERAPVSLAEGINQRVEGNPLFVQEYLGMLFDNDVFQPKPEGGWRFNILMLDTALNTLPNGLLGILQARLDDLSYEARQIIQAASVAGQVFWAGALQALVAEINVPAILNNLVMRGMIARDDTSLLPQEPQYHFRHSLYREVAYEMIPRAKREAFHIEMSVWLLERIAKHESLYPLLAEQFQASGQFAAALYTYVESVEVFVNQNRFSEALVLIDKSLGLANRVPRDDALPIASKLWTLRGQALNELGRYDEASAAAQSAVMLLKELPKNQLETIRIKAERNLGIANMRLGRHGEAYNALSRAHNLLPYNATSQISSVLSAFGQLHYYQGRLEDSYAYQKRAFDHAHTAQDVRLISSALVQLGLLDLERGNVADALDSFEQTLNIHRDRGLIAEQAKDLFYIGLSYLALLNTGKAYEYFSDASHLSKAFAYDDVLMQAYRAVSLIHLKRVTQGKSLLVDAMERSSKDVYVQNQLQLVYISSLAPLRDFVSMREQAMSFLQRQDVNPILKARAMRWLALASHHLGTMDAVETLRQALEAEKTYAGCDTWMCHYLLAQALTKPSEIQEHCRASAELIIERAETLVGREEMREVFLDSELVKMIFASVGIQSANLREAKKLLQG
jgi:class 3 adenylate cyclase/tetratricopeptide (TPR) repeat protein